MEDIFDDEEQTQIKVNHSLRGMKLHDEFSFGDGMKVIKVNGGHLYLTSYGYQITTSTFVPYQEAKSFRIEVLEKVGNFWENIETDFICEKDLFKYQINSYLIVKQISFIIASTLYNKDDDIFYVYVQRVDR